MRLKNRGDCVAGIVMIFILTGGTGLAANSSGSGLFANPQGHRDRDWDGYPNLGGSFQLRQTALNAGFNEGSERGRKDREDRKYSEYTDFEAYRNATKDYSSKLGSRDLYQRYYRMAFESGYDTENSRPGRQPRYRRGGNDRRDDNDRRDNNDRRDDNDRNNRRGRNWDRYGTYGGSFQLRQTALNAGYNEGIKQGRNDGRRGRRRNYREFSAYQKATEDYSSKLGDRQLYRRYYREGFENGYEDGYSGY